MPNIDFLSEILSKISAAGQPPKIEPSNTKHKVDLDLHLTGSITTTDVEVIPAIEKPEPTE